ncbi:MAG: hypothetical protein GOU98_02550 [Candidatus Altiarchaeota archaeon]|nr:hypothetical protein [Candidatus Altiarchaeota archaeon]
MADMEKRLDARQIVNDFFKDKRKRLDVKGVFDFSFNNKMKRRFLSEMNAIEGDFEHKAMSLADKGKDINIGGELNDSFEKLKKDFISDISMDDDIQGVIYKEIIEEISRL